MKVKELIKQLEQLNPDLKVATSNGEDCYEPVNKVTTKRLLILRAEKVWDDPSESYVNLKTIPREDVVILDWGY